MMILPIRSPLGDLNHYLNHYMKQEQPKQYPHRPMTTGAHSVVASPLCGLATTEALFQSIQHLLINPRRGHDDRLRRKNIICAAVNGGHASDPFFIDQYRPSHTPPVQL